MRSVLPGAGRHIGQRHNKCIEPPWIADRVARYNRTALGQLLTDQR